MELGTADEQKVAKDGTVEAAERSESNPDGGWYRLKKGLRGRFGMYTSRLGRSTWQSGSTDRATTACVLSQSCLLRLGSCWVVWGPDQRAASRTLR